MATIERRESYAYRYWCFLCPSAKEQRILRKGTKRIEKELDVANFITLQKMMRVTFNTIFTETERHLLRNNRLFLLNSSSSCSEDELSIGKKSRSEAINIQKALFFGPLLEGASPKKPNQDVEKDD